VPRRSFTPDFPPAFRADDDVIPGSIFSLLGRPVPRITGGALPDTLGTDTIPAMLSGREFVLNPAASQRIGAGNLQALNSGASNILTEEKSEDLNQKLIDKLDELIAAAEDGGGAGGGDINITVNSDGTSTQTGGSSDQADQNLARRLKDMVISVLEEQKRLGGSLRRGLT
jgi:hypothetical protein